MKRLIFYFPQKIKIMLLKRKFRKNKVKFNGKVFLNDQTFLEGHNVIHNKVNISNSQIGRATYIGGNTNLSNSRIGKFCSISQNIDIIQGMHPLNFVSTHPSFYSASNQLEITFVEKDKFEEFKKVGNTNFDVEIGNDVWIGKNVTIMAGVKIADGSVIGANALVTKDTKPYSINVGVPAKCIKYRFDEIIINNLLDSKWWNLEFSWIKENINSFENPLVLLDLMEKDSDHLGMR